MSITFECSSCQKKLKTKAGLAGKRIKCPGCGQVVLAPTPQFGSQPPPLPTASLDGIEYQIASNQQEIRRVLDDGKKLMFRFKTATYMATMRDLSQLMGSIRGQNSPEQQAILASPLVCPKCNTLFPDSWKTQAAVAELGHGSGLATCPGCGNAEALLVLHVNRPEEITEADVEALRLYWRSQAIKWWESQQRTEAICGYSMSCGSIKKGDGYHCGDDIYCDACIARRLSTALGNLKENPHYFGMDELRLARNFVAQQRTAKKTLATPDATLTPEHSPLADIQPNTSKSAAGLSAPIDAATATKRESLEALAKELLALPEESDPQQRLNLSFLQAMGKEMAARDWTDGTAPAKGGILGNPEKLINTAADTLGQGHLGVILSRKMWAIVKTLAPPVAALAPSQSPRADVPPTTLKSEAEQKKQLIIGDKPEKLTGAALGCFLFLVVAMCTVPIGLIVYLAKSDADADKARRAELTGAAKVPVWMEYLKGNDPAKRDEAVRELVKLGPEAKAAIKDLADTIAFDKRPEVRLAAVTVMGAIGPDAQGAEGALLSLRQNADKSLRDAAESALEKISGSKTVTTPPK